jgi:hypothetical protein
MPDRLLVEEVEGGVRVSLRRSGQVGDEARAAVAFVSRFTAAAREDLRWYLESYLGVPYAVYEARGQAIQERLRGWGEALFEGVFGAGKPGRDLYLQAREGEAELALTSRSPGFLGLPWELLKDPQRDTPLALAMTAFDRTISAAGEATPVPPGDALRVLMVIARPAGLEDIGYQMVARPLLQRLDAVRGKVVLEVLRPPTLERLVGVLRAAVEAGRPYHILHFDGHGTFGAVAAGAGGAAHFDAGAARGFLLFEQAGGGEQQVAADQFALAVSDGKVPLVVLNACRSGMVGEEAAMATRLLEGGAASVVAMGYSVYAVAAAEFMAEFYEALFAGRTVSAAVAAGRQRLHRNPQRPSPKGPLSLAVAATRDAIRVSFEGSKDEAAKPRLAVAYHQPGIAAEDRGDLTAAEEWYLKSLAILEALGDRPGLARSYHQLGAVAQDRGDLAAAEQWHGRSVTITGEIGDRPGLPINYGQLGLLAKCRGDADLALDWTVHSVVLFDKFTQQATGPALRHLSRLTAMLNTSALEQGWERWTGRTLASIIHATQPL